VTSSSLMYSCFSCTLRDLLERRHLDLDALRRDILPVPAPAVTLVSCIEIEMVGPAESP
jgi:hypothetical protein